MPGRNNDLDPAGRVLAYLTTPENERRRARWSALDHSIVSMAAFTFTAMAIIFWCTFIVIAFDRDLGWIGSRGGVSLVGTAAYFHYERRRLRRRKPTASGRRPR
ncbi:hypothetical protein [Streptomyces sp. NPDC052811]|uniref:hypothetical protein n=2 Tax=Streptomyces TaxID=1883 RepID=UPI0034402C09